MILDADYYRERYAQALRRENTNLGLLAGVTAERDAALRECERLKAPVSDEEWGKGCHLANRSHVNDIIANRSKPGQP